MKDIPDTVYVRAIKRRRKPDELLVEFGGLGDVGVVLPGVFGAWKLRRRTAIPLLSICTYFGKTYATYALELPDLARFDAKISDAERLNTIKLGDYYVSFSCFVNKYEMGIKKSGVSE